MTHVLFGQVLVEPIMVESLAIDGCIFRGTRVSGLAPLDIDPRGRDKDEPLIPDLVYIRRRARNRSLEIEVGIRFGQIAAGVSVGVDQNIAWSAIKLPLVFALDDAIGPFLPIQVPGDG